MSIARLALMMVAALALAALTWAIARHSARRLSRRLAPTWRPIVDRLGLQPARWPLGVALHFAGAIDEGVLHLLAWRRLFSKMSIGWRTWRVIYIEVDARWRCAPADLGGVVWRLGDDQVGFQGGRTLRWHGEDLPRDAPEVVPGVHATAVRELSADECALLSRRVATGQAWILPDGVSVAWMGTPADERAALEAAIADARALARLASTLG